MTTRFEVWVLLAVAAVVLPACQPAESQTEAADAEVERATRVTTRIVRRETFVERIDVPAVVIAGSDATLSGQAAGTVQTLVELGARVDEGDLIAQLDPAMPKAALAQAKAMVEAAKAGLDLAEETHERQKPLFEQEVISALELDGIRAQVLMARAELHRARAAVTQARQQLANTKVEAPFAGRVEHRFAERGEQVAPGSPVVQLVDTAMVKARAHVPERYAAEIRLGAAVTVRFTAYGLQSRDARVTFVGGIIDARNRTFDIEAELDNADGQLKPEMVARVELVRTRRERILTVSQTSLLRDAEGAAVFVVERKDGHPIAERRDVRIGAVSGGRVVIEEGLEDGDEVVTLGQTLISTGDTVEVVHGDDKT